MLLTCTPTFYTIYVIQIITHMYTHTHSILTLYYLNGTNNNTHILFSKCTIQVQHKTQTHAHIHTHAHTHTTTQAHTQPRTHTTTQTDRKSVA